LCLEMLGKRSSYKLFRFLDDERSSVRSPADYVAMSIDVHAVKQTMKLNGEWSGDGTFPRREQLLRKLQSVLHDAILRRGVLFNLDCSDRCWKRTDGHVVLRDTGAAGGPWAVVTRDDDR